MRIPIEEQIDGNWGKVGKDIKDGDRLQIKDGGIISESSFKNEDGTPKYQYVFKLMTKDKQEFNMALNKTSRNNLAKGYGQESTEWIGKVAKAFVVRQMIGDGLKNVLYLAPDGWKMTDDGEFVNPSQETTEIPDGPNPDDIPF